jgi:hypothetical protein
MTAVYFLLNYYPFWALPMVVICGELAYYYFNRHARGKFALMILVCLFFTGTSIAWFLYDGMNKGGLFLKELTSGSSP